MANIPEISLPSHVMGSAYGLEVTNSVLAFFVITAFVVAGSVWMRSRLSLVPGRFQVVLEGLVSYLDDLLQNQFIDKRLARRLLPLMVTLFLVIFIANQFSIIPLLQSLVLGETELFRVPTSDLSLPFFMALSVVLLSQIIALSISPIGHIGNYIKVGQLLRSRSFMELFNNGIEFFIGFMDIVGEIAKVLSLSIRLFGNVLAGELMILIISSLALFTQFFIPMPFYVLSMFSGVIQTLVFVLLSIGFMSSTVNSVTPQEREA